MGGETIFRVGQAAATIRQLRENPCWRLVGVPGERRIMDEGWRLAAGAAFPYRRIFDLRLGLTLRAHGVTEFATAHTRDFADFGFTRLFNPFS